MNPDTAELATAEPARRSSGRFAQATLALRLGEEQRTAARECWRALWSSRLLAWAAGAGAVLAFGYGPARNAFNPPGVTQGFGWLGNALAAPVARWDSDWYLVIARFGYRPDLGALTSSRDAFMPLYPLAIRGVSLSGLAPIAAGVLVSLVAFALALYGVHRLTSLELSPSIARITVLLLAFAPMSFYFSSVYSESLYMAFAVGLFWSARHGRWWLAGLLGALAAATRSTGLVLMLPALILYLYGPREDRAPDAAPPARPPAGHGGAPARARALARRMRPRYRLRADVLWIALVPCGVALYAAWLALDGGSFLAPLHAEHAWGRHFVGPYLGLWDGAKAAWDGVLQLLSFQKRHVYFPIAAEDPFIVAGHNLMNFAFVIAAVPLVAAALKRLPFAYGAYVLAALAMPLSYPVLAQPLMSVPRYMAVLFPLYMPLAGWLEHAPRARIAALAASGALMAFFAAQFATWHWVA